MHRINDETIRPRQWRVVTVNEIKVDFDESFIVATTKFLGRLRNTHRIVCQGTDDLLPQAAWGS